MDMFKKASKFVLCLYINRFGISRPLVSYSINFCSYEDYRKQRRGSWQPEPAGEGDIQIEFSSWLVV